MGCSRKFVMLSWMRDTQGKLSMITTVMDREVRNTARKSIPEGGTIVQTGTDMAQVVTPVLMDATDLVVEAGGTAEHHMEVESKVTEVGIRDNRTTAVEVVVTDRTMVPPAMTDGQV